MSTLSPQSAQFGIFELAELFDSADAALVVMKLRAWLAYNQINKPDISYRDGQWWTFRSLKKWCDHDFKWLTPRRLGIIMDHLESLKVITRRQYGASELKMSYWYTVNEDVLAKLVNGIKGENAFDADVKCSNAQVKWFDASVEYKTTEKEKIQKQKHSKTQTTTQPPADTEIDAVPGAPDVVVVPHPAPARNEESGEHSLNGEMLHTTQDPNAHGEPALVKAPHSRTAMTPQSPQFRDTPLTPLERDLIGISIVPSDTARLVAEYGEARVREVFDHTMRQRSVHTPAGFMIKALRTNLDVSVLRDQQKTTFNHSSPVIAATTDATLPPAVDDPAWNALIDQCAASIPHLKHAVCRAAGDRYEIAVEGPMIYLPLNQRKADIQQQLEQLTGHPVSLFITVDARLEAQDTDLMNTLVHEPPDPSLEYA